MSDREQSIYLDRLSFGYLGSCASTNVLTETRPCECCRFWSWTFSLSGRSKFHAVEWPVRDRTSLVPTETAAPHFTFSFLWFHVNAFGFLNFACTHEPRCTRLSASTRSTGIRAVFRFQFQYPSFAFTFVTPGTFSLVLFIDSRFACTAFLAPIDIPRALVPRI